ncbi:MAG: glycoside hydrolase family 9 protein [Oscillospiraceae bacterium]|nr:glycoside hydrolase family 9 protein [Oscillospiraceae bacterium]
MIKKGHFKRALSLILCLGMTVSSTVVSVSADAGEKPPEVLDSERVFPDPSTFSYDDVDINFAKALQYTLYFYDANKCGYDTDQETGEKLKQLEWRGDCHTEDYKIPLKPMSKEGADAKFGTNLSQEFIDEYKDILDPDGDGYMDCGGGMHDAGDHVKFGLPGSYAASTVGWGYYEFRDAYKKAGQQEHVEDILHWFNDFYMKGTYLDEDGNVIAFNYQVGEGNNDHNYWNPPELQSSEMLLDFARPAYFATVDTPASDMCAGTAAALAINYLNFKDTEPEYAQESLTKAKALYKFAVETHSEDEGLSVLSLGYDGGFYTSSYDYDELAWAAVWLYECTEDYSYIDDIISVDETQKDDMGHVTYTGYLKRIIKTTGSTWQNIWVQCWDTVWAGVFAKLAPITNTARDWYIFRWNLEFWSGIPHTYAGGMADEIWNMPYEKTDQIDEKDITFLKQTPAGFSMLNEYGSARYNSAAGLCAMVYRKETAARGEEDARFADWAEGQMEYMLGKNPMNRPYIVGYSPTAASHPHHRAAHGSTTLNMDDPIDQTHVLWGALVGGPDATDWHRDITKDYIYNEVAVDYNAGITGDLAGLYEYYGTDEMVPEENFPPKEAPKQQYWLKALVNQENKERTQYTIKIANDTSQPPKYVDGLKARYYFDISELVAAGQTIKDVRIEVYYDAVAASTNMEKSVKISDPILVKDNVYYIEMDWTGIMWHGTKELQLGIIVSQDANYNSNWDPTNDYSREGLEVSDDYQDTLNIPLYVGDKLVYGTPYGGVEETEPPVTTTASKTTLPPVTSSTDSEVIYGDINLDGVVEMTDLTALSMYIIGDSKLTEEQLIRADVNGDSKKGDLSDLSHLKQYIMKEPVTLGPQK